MRKLRGMNDKQLREVLELQQRLLGKLTFWLLFAIAWLIALTAAGAAEKLQQVLW